MSRLSVYWPDESCSTTTAVAVIDEPRIIPFPGLSSRTRGGTSEATPAAPMLDVISRARLLFANRQCRACGYPVVEPLDLDDAQVNRQGLEIPGTATIIGFRCHSCDCEWST